MSGHSDPKTTQERADRTPDRNVEAAVEGTFPASDPLGPIVSQGARAVPPEKLMGKSDAPEPPSSAAALTARFKSQEAAKLAVEALVRDGPVDRRYTGVESEGDEATVRLTVPQADRQRLEEMLQRQPGRVG